jgi:hypothetical protein
MAPSRGRALLFAWLLLVAAVVLLFDRVIASRGFEAFDAETYLAAGERLNAGHALYLLGPGDRPILTNPAFYTYPLLSPPPIAVLWRPLAALPEGWGLGLWWLACVAALLGTLGHLVRRVPAAAGLSVLMLAPFVAWELESANVEGLLFAGIGLTWVLAAHRRDVAAGAVVGLMAGIKLWPIVLIAWFLSQRRPQALVGAGLALVGVAAVSVVGAGLDAHLEYLEIARQTPASPLSIPGMLGAIGISVPWANYLVLALGVGLIFGLRNRPELAFAVAVPTMILGSPVLNINTYALLLIGLVPFAWPIAADARVRRRADAVGSVGTFGPAPELQQPHTI